MFFYILFLLNLVIARNEATTLALRNC